MAVPVQAIAAKLSFGIRVSRSVGRRDPSGLVQVALLGTRIFVAYFGPLRAQGGT